jgi:hypothetical protein
VELKSGELQSTDDNQFKQSLISWVTTNLSYPSVAGQLVADIRRTLSLPSGKSIRIGTILSPSIETMLPNLPEPIAWASGITYWTDGTVICLDFTLPTLRTNEPLAPKPIVGPPSEQSRFDQIKLTGTVTLGNLLGRPQGQQIEIDLKDSMTGTILVANLAELDSIGNFSIGCPSISGTYTVTAKGTHWLSQSITGVRIPGIFPAGPAFNLINGDCNGDNTVTSADLAIVNAAMGSVRDGPGWDIRADVNGDGRVDNADYAIVQANLGRSGN